MVPSTIILGDFNLDAAMQYRIDYPHKLLYNELSTLITSANLEQLVDFPTWSRNVNNVLKQSVLDHVYTNNFQITSNCTSVNPPFGDHVMVTFDLNIGTNTPEHSIHRDWRFYTSQTLILHLSKVDLHVDCNDVQQYWNILENIIINIVDKIAPLTNFSNDSASKTKPPPQYPGYNK